MAIVEREGYVYIDSCGNPIWSTFTEDTSFATKICWKKVTIIENITTTTTTTTTTSTSSTTTTTTTLATTTTTTSTSSTTTTSTTIPTTTTTTSSTTTTTTTVPTTTTTSSTTTTSTTVPTTTTTTSSTTTTTTTEATTTTTTSSTTTTTTTIASMDIQFAVEFFGDANMAGTLATNADVNAQSFNFAPDLGDGDVKGEIVTGNPPYTITIYVDTSGAGNTMYANNNIRILIKDSISGGTTIEASPNGITAPGEITFVSNMLSTTYNRIVITGP